MQNNTNPNANHSQQSNTSPHFQQHVNPAQQFQQHGEISHQQQQQHMKPPQQQQHVLPPQQQQHVLTPQQQQHMLPPQQQQHMLPPQQQQYMLPPRQPGGHQSLPQKGFQQQMYAPNICQPFVRHEHSHQQGQNCATQQGYQNQLYRHHEEYSQGYMSPRSQWRGEQGYACTQGNEVLSGPSGSRGQGGAMSMDSTSMVPQNMQPTLYKQSQHLDFTNYQAQTAGEYHDMTPSHCSGKREEGSQVEDVHGQSHFSVLPTLESDFHDNTQQLPFIENTHTPQHQDLSVLTQRLPAKQPTQPTPIANISSQQQHQLDTFPSFGPPSPEFPQQLQVSSKQQHQQGHSEGFMPFTYQQEVQGHTQGFLSPSTGGHVPGRDVSTEYSDGSKTSPCHTQQHQHVESQPQDSTKYHPTEALQQKVNQDHPSYFKDEFHDTGMPILQRGDFEGHLNTGFFIKKQPPHELNLKENNQQITSTKISNEHQHQNLPASTQIAVASPRDNAPKQSPSNMSSTKPLVQPHSYSKRSPISFKHDLVHHFQHQQYQQQYPDSSQWSNYPGQYPPQTSSMPPPGHYEPYAPYSTSWNPEGSGPGSTSQSYHSHDGSDTGSLARQSFAYGMSPPQTQVEEDEYRLHLLNLGPGILEETLENFLETCAEVDVTGCEWATNKKSVVVAFKTKPDVSAVMTACQKTPLEGYYIKVKTVLKSRCLKVTGLSPDCTEDSVRYFFENKKRGGPITYLQLFQEKQTAFVRFEHYGVAEKVLNCSPHSFRGCTLQVCIRPDLPGYMLISEEGDTQRTVMTVPAGETLEASAEVDEMKILVMNLAAKISEDTLRNFLESKADADVRGIEYGRNKTMAVVSFETKPDIEALKKGCEGRKVNGQKIEVSTVNRSKCVKVTGMSFDTTEDSIHSYFENKKRGGPVEDVELYPETNTAIVRFEQYGVAEKVCTSSYKFCGHNLTVVMHTETPDFVSTGISGSVECELAGTKSQMTPEHPDGSIDSLKILVKGINPETSEESMRNFLEAKADADIDDFEWAEDRTAAIVTFRSETDAKTLTKRCEGRKVDGHKIETRSVRKSKSVKVTGLSPDTTEDSVGYYFENKKRGGPVDDVELYQEANTAIVRFKQCGVAEKACSLSHTLHSQSLSVQMHMDVPGFAFLGQTGTQTQRIENVLSRSLQLVVKDINPVTSEDTLRHFLEAKANADVDDIRWGKGRTAAVVTFNTEPEIDKLKVVCKTRQVQNRHLRVESVSRSRSLKVAGLSGTSTEDTIFYYFENTRRSGGGPIEHIQLLHDNRTALIQFEEVGVAERICSRKHTLADKDVSVVVLLDIPGFVSADVDSEENEEPLKRPLECRHVLDIPSLILRFLKKSEEEKTKLDAAVQSIDGRLKFIQQPTALILEAAYTGNSRGMDEKDAWVKLVDSTMKQSIEDMELVVEDIDIPEECQMEPMNVMLNEQSDKLRVCMYQSEQKLHVVGHRNNVMDAIFSVNDMFLTYGPKETDSFDMKAFQIEYLLQTNFVSTCSKKYPSVEVNLKSLERQVVLKGPKSILQTVKLCILEMFSALCTDHYVFKTDLAVGLLKKSLSDKLMNADIKCTWEEKSTRKVHLFSETEIDLMKTKDMIKKTISEEVIKIDKSAAANLQSANWREKRRSLMETNQGRLMISEDSDVVIVAADNDIFQSVIAEIDRFFEINTLRHVLVPVDAQKVKFLKAHCSTKVRRIEQNLREGKLSIEFEEGFYSSGIKISGLNEGIAKARGEMEKLLGNIQCTDVKLALPGINCFFRKGKGREMVTAIEQNTHTVILPKDSQRNKTSDKSWTASAGVLSVVKGDMCHLKVDAIAFTANKDLKLVAGLGKAIAEKGGKIIQEEADKVIKQKGHLSDGAVVCTGSGRLPCKSVLHALLPKWQGSLHGEIDILQTVLLNILKACDKENLKSVALPALGTGQGYPLVDTVKVIVETLHEQWGEGEGRSIQEVILCDIKPSTVAEFVKTCERVFVGARPRHQSEAEDEDDYFDNISSNGSESESTNNASDSEAVPKAVQVITGELSKLKADVLVNPTGKEMNMSAGAVSMSLLKAGGPAIQSECKEKYPAGLKVNKIAVTTGGDLSCKKIFHGVLQQWNQGRDASDLVLKTMAFKCLKEADSQGFQSIAFPALGTGKLGFPADLSARLMFEAATNFFKNNPETPVKDVTFVMHYRDTAVKKAFEGQGSRQKRDFSARQKGSRSNWFKRDNRDDPGIEDYPGSYVRGSVKVDILNGDLTREKTDCIISCSDESFDLRRGALSKAVLSQAGSKLQDECSSKKEDLSKNGLAVTQGYKLSCKNVIHLKVQSSPREWGSLLLASLEEAEGMGITSLSIPALGTGGQRMSPEKMASSLLYAVNKFADTHKHSTLTLIRVVIFQQSMVNTYKVVFAGSKPRAHTGQQYQQRGEHRSGQRSQSETLVKSDDQITMSIFSDNRENIRKAKERIQAMCKDEFDEKHISDRYATKIEKLDDVELSYLHDIANNHSVVLTRKKSELVLIGRVKDVSEVKEQILSKFQGDTITEHMKEEAQMVAKLVQWSYVVDDTSKSFTVGLNCRLEKAYTAKEKTLEIKDPKGRTYTVDFTTMTESPKTGGKAIKIDRFEKAIRAGLAKMVKGEKEALAGTTTVYFSLKPERNFKGDAEDLHFRTAESQFYRLLSGHTAQYKVSMVEYVVTPHLVKKFQSAQEDLKKSRGEALAEPILAFHGTNVNNITNICEKGFLKAGDPGFKMKSGNAYGDGVYFSEFPDYSMSYISGATKLLLCQVLLGKTYTISSLQGGGVQAGYDSHTSSNGKELVIFDTSRILPCYIVHYS